MMVVQVMNIAHAMMVVQVMKIAHAMIVVEVMKIVHTMMVVQVMKIAHAMIVVQVMKIMHAMMVVQVMEIAHAMKAVVLVIKTVQVMKGKKFMRPESELEDSYRDENSQNFHRLQSSLMNTSLSGHIKAASHPPPLPQVPISSLGSSMVSRPTKILTRLVR